MILISPEPVRHLNMCVLSQNSTYIQDIFKYIKYILHACIRILHMYVYTYTPAYIHIHTIIHYYTCIHSKIHIHSYINYTYNTCTQNMFIYGYMVKDQSDSERGYPLPPHGLLSAYQQGSFYMHHHTDRIIHTTAFVTPIMIRWVEQQ